MPASPFQALGPKARSVASDLDRVLDGPDRSLRIFAGEALLNVDFEATRARVIAVMSSMLADQSMASKQYELFQVLKSGSG